MPKLLTKALLSPKNRTLAARYRHLLFTLGVLGLEARGLSQSAIPISGWVHPSLKPEALDTWLGNDPVIGRMTCPTLARLNLRTKNVEPLILENISTRTTGSNVIWDIKVRKGIYWWSGSEVSPEDVAQFLTRVLKAQPSPLPSWTISPPQGQSLSVTWTQAPSFGPYIIQGLAFYRNAVDSSKSLYGKECAGRYIPTLQGNSIALMANTHYSDKTPQNFVFSLDSKSLKEGIRFVMPQETPHATRPRELLAPAQCPREIDLPALTGILWNIKGPNAVPTATRKAISHLLPRRSLVRFAMKGWGSSTHQWVPAHHPAFRAALEFSNRIQRIGRQEKILLSSQQPEHGLLEKVVGDILDGADFAARFTRPGEAQHSDGTITSFVTPWPDMTPASWLSSPLKEGLSLNAQQQVEMHLKTYRLSLTHGKPDFGSLAKAYTVLEDEEIFTVLAHHKACLHLPNSMKPTALAVSDPDWFFKMVL
jgi:hypothetical protein